MTENYYAPTDRADIRSQINRLYFETVFSAADLENWRLIPEGKRPGTFKAKFTPFHSAFLKLYFCTRAICTTSEIDTLKNRIDEWISHCKGSVYNSHGSGDVLINVGLKLFDEWSKKLYDQSILEFR